MCGAISALAERWLSHREVQARLALEARLQMNRLIQALELTRRHGVPHVEMISEHSFGRMGAIEIRSCEQSHNCPLHV